MSVFSDPRIQELLKDFIPVAEECLYTQLHKGKDERYKFFWDAVFSLPPNRVNPYDGHPGPLGKWLAKRRATGSSLTWTDEDVASILDLSSKVNPQGHWVIDATGKAYGYSNIRSSDNDDETPVEPLLELLSDGKREFDRNPPPKIVLDSFIPQAKPVPPEGTVIARSFARISPLPAGAGAAATRIGRDHLWITPEDLEMLTRGLFPDSLAKRLVRFHLRDYVANLGQFWRADEIERADFRATLETQGENTLVLLRGDFAMRTAATNDGGINKRERHYEGKFEGEILLTAATHRVVGLNFLAEGTAGGRVGASVDDRPEDYPLKVAFILVEDDVARAVPPQGTVMLREYLKPRG